MGATCQTRVGANRSSVLPCELTPAYRQSRLRQKLGVLLIVELRNHPWNLIRLAPTEGSFPGFCLTFASPTE